MHGEKLRKASLTAGKEWWGKRPLGYTSTSSLRGDKFYKRLLHKIERRQGENQIKEELSK